MLGHRLRRWPNIKPALVNYSFIHLFIYSFIHLFIFSFFHFFILLFIHLFIYSFYSRHLLKHMIRAWRRRWVTCIFLMMSIKFQYKIKSNYKHFSSLIISCWFYNTYPLFYFISLMFYNYLEWSRPTQHHSYIKTYEMPLVRTWSPGIKYHEKLKIVGKRRFYIHSYTWNYYVCYTRCNKKHTTPNKSQIFLMVIVYFWWQWTQLDMTTSWFG